MPSVLREVSDLIIDVGAHKGDDAEFYLRKGFRVVAIEANPLHAAAIRERLGDDIRTGRLTLLDVGILDREGEIEFYRNLQSDDWSSFDPVFGCRNGTPYDVIPVRCITFDRVLAEFGIPYYLKIDIEGAERHVFEALIRHSAAPAFLSTEASSPDYLDYMRTLGYRAFQLVEQGLLPQTRLPKPAREGVYVPWQFGPYASGLFGAERPGRWSTLAEVTSAFVDRTVARSLEAGEWYDFHAARADHVDRLAILRDEPDLVIDVGAHKGADSEFYLRKGFRVVAIEANPSHARAIRARLAEYLRTGQLTLLEVGILDREGEIDFYSNLDNDEWSSFDRTAGTRQGTKYDVLKIPCVTFDRVLREYGVPYYLKLDIEGAERYVFDALARHRAAPAFLSTEATSIDYLAFMRVLGYDAFQLVQQGRHWQTQLPNPAREGAYIDWQFPDFTTGPFGAELPDAWHSYRYAAFEFLSLIYSRRLRSGEWYDFHAARPDQLPRLRVADPMTADGPPADPSPPTITAASPTDAQVAAIAAAATRMRDSGIRTVVVAGAGVVGRTAAVSLSAAGLTVVALDDLDRSQWGTDYRGVPILPPDEAMRLRPDAYFIGSFGAVPQIRARLRAQASRRGAEIRIVSAAADA